MSISASSYYAGIEQNNYLLVVGSSARKHKAKTNMAQATSLSLRSRFIVRWSAWKITSTSWFVQFWSKSSKCNVWGASTAMIISFQEKIVSRDSRCQQYKLCSILGRVINTLLWLRKIFNAWQIYYRAVHLNTITSFTSSKLNLRYHYFNPPRMFLWIFWYDNYRQCFVTWFKLRRKRSPTCLREDGHGTMQTKMATQK